MTKRSMTITASALALLATVALVSTSPAGQTGQRTDVLDADQQAVAEFQKTLDDYVQLRNKVKAPVKAVPTDATPKEIDDNQAQTSRGVVAARAGAKPGDIFRPAFQSYLRRKLTEVFNRPDGKAVRFSILDENPIGTSVRINGAYPDTIPLTTMPPQVLEALPRLPMDIEYRFVGDRLILFDSHAHLILDYVDRALPGA